MISNFTNNPASLTPRRSTQWLWRILKDWRLLLYNLVSIVLGPYLLARKLRRYLFNKTRYEFLRERWFIPLYGGAHDDNSALHVVFISVGLGEQHQTEQLDAALKKACPNVRTTWTAKPQEIVDGIRSTHPQQAASYLAFEFLPPVINWLNTLQPDVIVSVEKMWIPNLLWGARAWGAKNVVVSGRAGRFAGRGWKGALWRGVNRWSLQACDIICLQSEAEKNWIAPALPQGADVRVTGAIKTTLSASTCPTLEELQAWVEYSNPSRAPLFAAGSTAYREEEEWVLDALEAARKTGDCVLLLAPRRLHRAEEVLELLRERNLKVSRRSEFVQGSTQSAQADVLLLDTMGELAAAYRFCIAAFIGGTLQGQGHNVVEPLEWRAPVFFGSGKGPAGAGQILAIEAGAGFRVESSKQLGEYWQRILQDEAWRESLRARCEEVVAAQRTALEENLRAIVEMVDRVSQNKR